MLRAGTKLGGYGGWSSKLTKTLRPDGQRFLIGTLVGGTIAAPPTMILNWIAELKK